MVFAGRLSVESANARSTTCSKCPTWLHDGGHIRSSRTIAVVRTSELMDELGDSEN